MSSPGFEPSDLRRKLAGALVAMAALWGCSQWQPGAGAEAGETKPPVIAAADPVVSDPTLILEADNERPAPLEGVWKVDTGGRTCTLTLRIGANEVSGQTAGCSYPSEVRPIAIGLVSGSSFLFQTGRGSEGWIWSGRYVRERNVLEGRREHVITGKLESFVARR